MNESSLNQIIDTALGRIRSVVDSNTAIGEPIRLGDKVVALPFSKISVGFGAGGADFDPKKGSSDEKKNFVGGNGAGISVTPLGFIIVNGTDVQVVDLNNPVGEGEKNPVAQTIDGISALIDKVPELVSKLRDKKKNKSDTADEAGTESE